MKWTAPCALKLAALMRGLKLMDHSPSKAAIELVIRMGGQRSAQLPRVFGSMEPR